MTTNARPPAAAPRPSRMTLESLRRARRDSPDRTLVYGTPGVGKTTWAACAPAPVFLPTERGLDDLGPEFDHVMALPQPETFDEVLAAVRLFAKPSEYRTFVIDTVDALEPIIWRHLCQRNNWSSIEQPGYGKGQLAAGEVWRSLMLELERMQDASGMDVLLLGHAVAKLVANPSGPDYARFDLKLDKHAAAVISEWTKNNLFATKTETIAKEKSDKTAKVTSVGARVLYTESGPGWAGKNRFNLPFQLPLDYSEYVAARSKNETAPAEALEAEARARLAEWAPDATKAAAAGAAIDKAKGDAVALAKLVNVLNARINQKETV